MIGTVALIVQPIANDPRASGEYADEALITATLAVLGALEERGLTVLLHSDATVAIASALSGIERRPEVPMEREPSRTGGASIVYIPISDATDEVSERMLRGPIADRETAVDEAELTVGLSDILLDTGLLRSEASDLGAALYEYHPAVIIVVARPSDQDGIENAMEVAEAYAKQLNAQLYSSARYPGRDQWHVLDEMLTEEQREIKVLPFPTEETDTRRIDDTRIAIEQAAINAARLSLSAERVILRMLGDLD